MHKKRAVKIALAIFNSITENTFEYWGNLSSSILSGEMTRRGLDNDLYLLLMQVGDLEKNNRTLKEFVKRIQGGGYTTVYFDSLWLPEIKQMLLKASPDLEIICKDEMTEEFLRARPEFSTDIKYSLLQPNFDYICIGGSSRHKQKLIDICGGGTCAFDENLERNPYYAALPLQERRKYRGCGYCSISQQKVATKKDRIQEFLHVMRHFQKHLPHLERVSLPGPESFFDILADIAPKLKAEAFKPVKFQIQLRPDVIVNRQDKIEEILRAYEGSGFCVHLATVGFENFSKKELQILHRGYPPETNTKALEVITRLHNAFPVTLDLSRAVASFILFNPYTTIEDITENLKQIAAHDFSLFHTININKVRIHPQVGLYALSQLDGLLAGSDPQRTLTDLPRGGYRGDYGYRFLDEQVAAVYSAFAEAEKNLTEDFQKHKLYILQKILDFVTQNELGSVSTTQ
jgi:hypothetical protein